MVKHQSRPRHRRGSSVIHTAEHVQDWMALLDPTPANRVIDRVPETLGGAAVLPP
jgi:hypothetical protein